MTELEALEVANKIYLRHTMTQYSEKVSEEDFINFIEIAIYTLEQAMDRHTRTRVECLQGEKYGKNQK